MSIVLGTAIAMVTLWNLKPLKKKLFTKKKKFVGPVKPNPPPWDVPLDQTKAPMHREGDITSV